MARKPQINFYPSLGGYFTTIKGVRYLLAKGPEDDPETKKTAEKEFKKFIYLDSVEEPTETIAVYSVLSEYTKYVERNRSRKTYEKVVHLLTPFIAEYQELQVCKIKPQLVHDFLYKMSQPHETGSTRGIETWNQTTQNMFASTLKTALKWAEEVSELIRRNPLHKKLDKPPKLTRSENAVMNKREYGLILEFAQRRRSSDYSTILQLLWVTGARPAEIYRAKKEEWKMSERSIIIEARLGTNRGYKQARRGKARVIHVPDEFVAIVNGHAQWSGDGYLFHNERGVPYTKNGIESRTKKIRKAINREFLSRGEEPPIKNCVSLYSTRHAFAGRWLKSGGSIHDLATIIDSSVEVIMKHYGHLASETAYLKHQLDNFIGRERGNSDGREETA